MYITHTHIPSSAGSSSSSCSTSNSGSACNAVALVALVALIALIALVQPARLSSRLEPGLSSPAGLQKQGKQREMKQFGARSATHFLGYLESKRK